MDEVVDTATARRLITARRVVVADRLAAIQLRLGAVRSARSEWTDEEHDPEGFTLTHEWSHAEGSREDYQHELVELDQADARVAAGTYGICTSCSLPIPIAQLERRPARQLCVSCTDRALR